MSYPILAQLLPAPSKRRPGQRLSAVRFLVAHDTGNPGSTARQNGSYYARTAHQESASAHLFVDDREILECIPALTGPPEKAWHVRYECPEDNGWFGEDANDGAIGVELCYGPQIDAEAAYARYVWVLAELCRRFGLSAQKIVGHFQLDPARRTDPVNALSKQNRSFSGLLDDVQRTLRPAGPAPVGIVAASLRLRTRPDTQAPVVRVAQPEEVLVLRQEVQGERVANNARWFGDGSLWWWSGGLRKGA